MSLHIIYDLKKTCLFRKLCELDTKCCSVSKKLAMETKTFLFKMECIWQDILLNSRKILIVGLN